MRCFLLVLSFLAFAQSTSAQVFRTDAGKAAFTGEIPVNSFTGISEVLQGEISLIDRTVRFVLELNSLDTGIEKRDRDMRKTLQTHHFPEAVFEGRLVSDFDPGIPEIQPARVQGQFSLHGVTREIEVTGGLQVVDGGLLVTAEWMVLLSDYAIPQPRMLIMKVADEVDLRIEARLMAVDAP